MPPDPNAIRDELDRVLSSETFSTATRHSRLLRYLVERTLAGEGDQLKEYVLGTEVFDRPDTYDPRLDSIVRVEVRRLRNRLEDYYKGPGAKNPVVITIARGSYVPSFESQDAVTPARIDAVDTPPLTRASSSVPAVAPRARPYPIGIVIAAALTVAIGTLAVMLVLNDNRMPAQASTGPRIAVLPFEHYSTRQEDALVVAQLTDALTTELARTGQVSVTSRTTAARYTNGPQSVREIAKTLNVDFVVEGSAEVLQGRIRVTARLVDGRLDRKVWVAEYDLGRSDVTTGSRTIAADAAAAALRYLGR